MNELVRTRLFFAERYAKLGWRVIPSHWSIGHLCDCPNRTDALPDQKYFACGHPVPICSCGQLHDSISSIGKHPLFRNWITLATTKMDIITSWFLNRPNANISIVTGKESGIFVLDVDGETGEQTLIKLQERYGPLPDTPMFITGSNGVHYIFRYPPSGAPTRCRIVDGIDIRGEGGQIIAPPSKNIKGDYGIHAYHAPQGFEDLDGVQRTVPVAPAPSWLLSMISSVSSHINMIPAKERFDIRAALNGVSQGQRDTMIFRLAAKMRDEDIPIEIALDWIKKAAANCNPPFPIPIAEQKVIRAYKKYVPRVQWDKFLQIPMLDIRRNSGSQSEWAKPYPIESFTGDPVPEDVFPQWFSQFINTAAKHIQVPSSMVSMIALTTVSACVAKKGIVHISPIWKEPLNIYTVVACPPSTRKSPTFALCSEPLVKKQKAIIEEFENIKNQRILEQEMLRSRIDVLKRQYARGNAAVLSEINTLRQKLNEIESLEPPRILADDITPEKLAGLLFKNKERIAILSADGADIFTQMGPRYKNTADPTLYIKGWSGDLKIVDRMGRTEYLRSPIIVMGLAVQPKILRGLITSEAAQQGLLARILYCFPEDNIGSRQIIRQPSSTDLQIYAAYNMYLTKLLDIPIPEPIIDLNGEKYDQTNILTFDEDALELFFEFEQFLESQRGKADSDFQREWLGKLGGNTARIIGLLHLIENIAIFDGEDIWKIPIQTETVTNGIKLALWLCSHAHIACEEMESDYVKSYAITLTRWFIQNNIATFFKNEAIKKLGTTGQKTLNTLTYLIEHGYIRPIDQHLSGKNTQYEVNPFVLNQDYQKLEKITYEIEENVPQLNI